MISTRKKFCCSDSKNLYEDYYVQQSGGLPAFHGVQFQRGYGIGSVLGGLFRSALPLIKQGAKTIGKEAVRGAARFASDLMEGKKASAALENRFKEAGENIIKQTRAGKSIKRKRSSQTSHKATSKKKRKTFSNIFH